jgi:hypothetical protein
MVDEGVEVVEIDDDDVVVASIGGIVASNSSPSGTN